MLSKKKYTFPSPATTADSSQPKHRKLMPKPTGVSDVEWSADVQRREAVTTDKWRRLDAKKIRDAAVAVDQGEASCAGMMNLPDHNLHAAWRGY
ncbi:hypothetical protein D1007_08022 [Hordeum vulgare]|nr:hypothetical protein D1007_08022 [Hordeum vulgare]